MKIFSTSFLAFLLLFGVSFSAYSQAPKYMKGTLLIRYSDGTDQSVPNKSLTTTSLSSFGIQVNQPLWDIQKSTFTKEKRALKKTRNNLDVQKIRDLENKLMRTHYASVFDQNQDLIMLARKISALPGIEYAEPVYLYETHEMPNDSLVSFVRNIYTYQKFDQAWTVEKASSDVVVAIVDSGVDYTHDDLKNKTWVNYNEVPSDLRAGLDANSDGRITAREVYTWLAANNGDYNGDSQFDMIDFLHPNSPFTNNTDTDGNEFIDDLVGWDFWESGYTNATRTQDNDPKGVHSNHGTHVAGISAAETNNRDGIPGTGYNASYLAIKVGGVADDPSTPTDDESRSIGFGNAGILYAVMMGADVINNSWGGGGFSATGRDVVAYAAANDVVVVGSGGNSGVDSENYPAAYEGSMAVGSVNTNSDVKSGFSNFGYYVDVMATGNGIQSTILNNSYAPLSGTSMSSPVVAGLAALVRSKYPDWPAKRIALQIRSTSRRIDSSNDTTMKYKLGNGIIDAFKAVNTPVPGIEISNIAFLNNDNLGIQVGEPGKLIFDITNHGETSSDLVLSLEALVEYIDLTQNSVSIGALATNETRTVEIAVEITTSNNILEKPSFKIVMIDASVEYSDFKILEVDDFLFEVVENNNIVTSFSSDGTMGFSDPNDGETGIGFSVNMGTESGSESQFTENLLYSSSLAISANNRTLNQLSTEGGGQARHFRADSLYRLKPAFEDLLSGSGVFNTSGNILAPSFSIKLETFAFNTPEQKDALYVLYNITNTGNNPVEGMRVGIFSDWDLGDFSDNLVGYSQADSMIYVFENNNPESPYVSTLPINGISSIFAIDNALTSSPNDSVSWGLYDGFTDQEKIWMLNNGLRQTSISTPTDVSITTASGPYSFLPGETIKVGFIHVFGRSLPNLLENARSARANIPFQVTDPTTFLLNADPQEVAPGIPNKTELVGNFPNPFNPTTQIKFALAQNSDVELSVFNLLGQRVAVLISKKMAAGTYQQEFDASRLASGMYLVQLKTNMGIQTQKMTLLK